MSTQRLRPHSPLPFGTLLKQHRQEAGLTQEGLAEQAQVGVRTLKDIESGVTATPHPDTARRLVAALPLDAEQQAGLRDALRAVPHRRAAPIMLTTAEARSGLALPSGTVTFLFTEVEDSAARGEQRPDTRRSALARHDTLLHAAITIHGGAIVKTVDGTTCAAFHTAPAALATAVAAQERLAAEPWGEVGPLRVRMALHTGMAEERDGDYSGPAFNRVARLLAAGHGGQVLLSEATYALVRDALPVGTALRDLGAQRLRDLIRPERIYQAVNEDLPAEFPPLRTLANHPHNLPVQPTPLIGRARELAAVGDLLRRPEVRLVTLTGAGGSGKTRLGLQVAAEALEQFPDGVFFVSLAPLSDSSLVVPTIARILSVVGVGGGGQPLHERLHAYLHEKELLLLLDNFEQVAEAAAAIAALLAACPALRVLVTSRAPLRVRGEHEYGVPPLNVPDLTRLPPLPALTQYEAVRLFIERARDVKADFAVSTETAPAVAAICVRLDGLPLAIELAAARIRLLSPQALLERLSSRLTVLIGGPRDLPTRQQTLRGTIDWSYSLLPREEQALFARLSVFAGGFTFKAAGAVCRPEGEVDILEGMTSLVEKSLLWQEGEDDLRLVMLETIREYAAERLEQAGDAEGIRRAHAAYFVRLAEEASAAFENGVDPTWLDRLEREHTNMRAALSWLVSQDEGGQALRLVAGLWRLWWIRGYIREGRDALEAILARTTDAISSDRAIALRAASHLAMEQDDLAHGEALADAAVDLARRMGGGAALGDVLMTQGLCAQLRGDIALARRIYEESLALARGLGRMHRVGIITRHLGQIAQQQGDVVRATELLHESVTIHRELNDARSLMRDYLVLAELVEQQEKLEQAETLFRESLSLGRYVREMGAIAHLFDALARLAAARREPVRAAQLTAAAAGVRETYHIVCGEDERELREMCLARVRAELVDGWETAWQAGQAMSLEQAIAYALAEAELPAG